MRQRFPPAGCKMNDAGYPFRGEYKMDPPLNHGHTGAIRKGSTSLMLRITGTNLAIEKLQPCKGQTLHCELGIDNGPQKPVVFPSSCEVIPVPQDGHEYHLTAVVQGASAKHHCKMILCGGEGRESVVRLRAPADQRLAGGVVLRVDGEQIQPSDGWYTIPLQARECSLDIVEKNCPTSHPTRQLPQFPLPAASSTFIVQSTPGVDDNAVLFCSGNGESVHLSPNRPVAVAANSGPFTIQLPRVTLKKPRTLPETFTASHAEPVEADFPAYRVPELETRVISSPEDDKAPLMFVATADGFMVELTGDNGASTAAYGTAQLRLPDRMEHRVRIIIMDTAGRTLLRQNAMVPATEHLPVSFSISEDARSNPVVLGKHSSEISIDNLPPVRGDLGVLLDGNTRHVVVVREGGSSSVFEIAPRQTSPSPVTPSATTATPAGAALTAESWVEKLSRALQFSNLDQTRHHLQSIIPQSSEAASIVEFLSGQLFKTPPTISFKRNAGGVTDIQCAGYSVMVAIDNATPSIVAAGGGAQVGVGHSVTLSAITPSNGRVVASCCMHLVPSTEKNLDEELVTRLLDIFQRHTNSPDAAACELVNITSPLSTNGHRLIPLIGECLRRLSYGSQRPLQLIAGEAPEGTRLIVVTDGQQSKELVPGSVMEIACGNMIRVSVRGPPFSARHLQNNLAKNLVEAYYRHSPPPLPARWAAVPTDCPEEQDLLQLLLQILRDHENELARQRAQGGVVSGTMDTLQFTCSAGCLQNVRTVGPCRLSVDVDGTGFTQIEQGAQVPQGYTFPSGSEHRVHIIARDAASGAPCAEAHLTLKGAESMDAPMRVVSQNSCFLDANVSHVADEVHLRLVCPTKLHIVCDVDGGGGIRDDAWKSDLTAKMSAARPHDVHVRLVNDAGAVMFEQRFSLPAMMPLLWSVGLENASLLVENSLAGDGGLAGQSVVTASLDRSPEKSLTGPLHFDSNSPHNVLLRRYTAGAGAWRLCTGELSLRVPAFVDPLYLQELASLYRAARQDGSGELRSQLNQLHSRIPSNAVKELISALIEHLVPSPHTAQRSGSTDARVHFRLSGDESLFSPRYGSGRRSSQ